MLGAIKSSSKARAAREARFAAEAELGGVLAPQTKVMAHPESIRVAGDATSALLHVCRKRLASGSPLTALQLTALANAGVDVENLRREALDSASSSSAPAIYGDAHGGAGAARPAASSHASDGSLMTKLARSSSKGASKSRGREKDARKDKERKLSKSKTKSKSASKPLSTASSRPRSRSRASARSDSSSDADAGRRGRDRSRSMTKRKRVAASDSDD